MQSYHDYASFCPAKHDVYSVLSTEGGLNVNIGHIVYRIKLNEIPELNISKGGNQKCQYLFCYKDTLFYMFFYLIMAECVETTLLRAEYIQMNLLQICFIVPMQQFNRKESLCYISLIFSNNNSNNANNISINSDNNRQFL